MTSALEAEAVAELAIASILDELPADGAARVLSHTLACYRVRRAGAGPAPSYPEAPVLAPPSPPTDEAASDARPPPPPSPPPAAAPAASEVHEYVDRRQQIRGLAADGLRPVEISERVGISAAYVGVILSELVQAGQLERVARGVYRAPAAGGL